MTSNKNDDKEYTFLLHIRCDNNRINRLDLFLSGEIITEVNQQMNRNNKSENQDYRIDTFVCCYFKKRGWKDCPRAVRHMQAKTKRNELILKELREKHLLNGAGKLPTVAQVS